MNNLITRSISALVYAVIFISAILYSPKTYQGLIAIFGVICLWEFSKIIKLKSIISIVTLVLISGVSLYLNLVEKNDTFFIVASVIGLLMFLYALIKETPILYSNDLQKAMLSYFYLVLPFLFLAKLPFVNGVYSAKMIIAIIVLIWTNDSFAYLVGKNFGKNKLFETVSPKKTIEGFLGGLFFTVVFGIIIGYYTEIYTIKDWTIISFIVAALGTLGDLVESKFKRQAGVKDSGTIMPGHGGLLDRLDSLFFLAPFVYLYVHFLMTF